MLEYFGPRKKKKVQMPHFAYFELDKEDTWSFVFFDLKSNTLKVYKNLSIEELWRYMTIYGTPLLWYSYDLPWFVSSLIKDVVNTSWIEERVKTLKGKEVEKFSLISRGGSEIIRFVVRGEKERKISKKKLDVTLANIEPFYRWGPEELGKSFNSPFKDSLVDRFYGMVKVHEFITEKLQVNPKVSLAGAALNCLQTYFIESKIPKLNKELEDFIQPAFFGGMTEVYKIYAPHSWGYDKNGLYAEAYLNTLPVKGAYVKERLSIEDFMGMKDLGFVDVDIYIPENLHKPTLPIHTPNGVMRLVGELKSTREYPIRFFSEELKSAVRKGKAVIRKINYGVFFKMSKPILEEWAAFTNKLKDGAETEGERTLAKDTQNSIYGKFAQKQLRQITHLGKVPKDRRKDPNITIIDDDTPIWFEDVEVRLANTLPHIAAAITAWARILASNDADRLESENIEISYHDTDAFHTNSPIPLDMVGNLSSRYKCEFKDCEAWHFAQKMYVVVGVKQKFRGIPNALVTPEMLDEFIKNNKPMEVEWNSPQTLQEVLVEKFLYKQYPDKFQTVLENRIKKNTRSFPGGYRTVTNILELDTRRKQLSLTESRPFHAEEVFQCRK